MTVNSVMSVQREAAQGTIEIHLLPQVFSRDQGKSKGGSWNTPESSL